MGINRGIDITADQRKTVLALLGKHLPNTAAWVYGSRAKWTARPQYDLDMVVFATLEQNGRVADLREAFEESNLSFRVDLFVWDDVPESFRKRIEVEHVVLVEKEERVVDSAWRETVYGMLSADFFENSLADLCHHDNGVQTGPFGSQLHQKDYVPVGTPILTVEHLGENRIIHQDLPHVSDYDRERLSKYTLRKGDIVFSRVGSVDRRALVREAEDGWLFSGRCLRVRPDPNKIDPGYLSYFFGWASFQEHIRSIAVGATMPSLNTQILSDVVVPYPPLPEQRAIAHILGTLDDKIELNRRMNETLEEMARALFKSWFVDFDPVRAKMEGRDTGLPKPLADLFPDQLVDSELGPIPEGWEVKALGELIELAYGKALKAADRKSGSIPVYGSNGQVGWHDKKLAAGPGIVVGRKGNPGIVTWTHSDFFPIDTTFYVVPRNTTGELPFLFFALTAQDLPSVSADSAVPGLNRNLAYMNRQLVPDKLVVDEFNHYASTIFTRRHRLEEESRTLAALRDALLPKLVSGELRVGKAEPILETTN